jgi:hypothetical protein
MWKGFVQDARQGFCPATSNPTFAINLGRTFFSAILEWVSGELSLPELEAWKQYGFTVAIGDVHATTPTVCTTKRLRNRRGCRNWKQKYRANLKAQNGTSTAK